MNPQARILLPLIALTLAASLPVKAHAEPLAPFESTSPLLPVSTSHLRIFGEAGPLLKQDQFDQAQWILEETYLSLSAHLAGGNPEAIGPHRHARLLLARCYTFQGKYQQAVELFRQEFFPPPEEKFRNTVGESANLIMCFALALYRTGEIEQAVTVFEEGHRLLGRRYSMIRRDADEVESRTGIRPGMVPEPPLDVNFRRDRFTAEDFEAAALTAIGMADIGRGWTDAALRNFERAVDIKPDFQVAHYYIGKLVTPFRDRERGALAFQRASAGPDREVREAALHQAQRYPVRVPPAAQGLSPQQQPPAPTPRTPRALPQ